MFSIALKNMPMKTTAIIESYVYAIRVWFQNPVFLGVLVFVLTLSVCSSESYILDCH